MSKAQGISTVGAVNEIFDGTESPNVPAYTETGYIPGPYGLGVRVPMIAISPWSKGGYVNSQVFDHTSLIRFLERRFGHQDASLIETNITEWRRTVTGDLTSCFNFAKPNEVAVPKLPTTSAYAPPTAAEIAAGTRFNDYVPVPPTSATVARQEPGIRPARPLPYRPLVQGTALRAPTPSRSISATRVLPASPTMCDRAAPALRVLGHSPSLRTTRPTMSWNLGATGASSAYDLSVYGPNGWYRLYKGSVAAGAANLSVETDENMYDDAVRLTIHNRGASDVKVSIREHTPARS